MRKSKTRKQRGRPNGVTLGDVVPLSVFRVEASGLWVLPNGQTGSVPVTDFTDNPPIAEEHIPRVGDVVAVRVFHVAPRTLVESPFGKLICDFTASLVPTPGAGRTTRTT